jgi:hypothetical protein
MPERMARADLEGEAAHRGAGGGTAPASVRPWPATSRRHRLAPVVVRALLGAWMAAGGIFATALVLGRWIAPAPAAAAGALHPRASSDGRPLVMAPAPPSSSAAASRATAPWVALHVLYAGCRCSDDIFAQLFRRGPIAGTRERIVLVAGRSDDATAARYRARAIVTGFTVETVTPDDLARRFGVEAAPLLVIADPTGRIRYAGGYTAGQPGQPHLALGDEADDETILADLMAGRRATDPPLLAAAVSRRLQDALDPPTSRDRPARP